MYIIYYVYNIVSLLEKIRQFFLQVSKKSSNFAQN